MFTNESLRTGTCCFCVAINHRTTTSDHSISLLQIYDRCRAIIQHTEGRWFIPFHPNAGELAPLKVSAAAGGRHDLDVGGDINNKSCWVCVKLPPLLSFFRAAPTGIPNNALFAPRASGRLTHSIASAKSGAITLFAYNGLRRLSFAFLLS